MTMAKSAVISLTIMALFRASMAATYTVGDTAGWTTKGNINYNKWTEGKEFRVGDTIVFKYNNAMHDVHEVSQEDYEACSSKNSLKQYTSGSDSITLKTSGHHYFLCGIPGHCQAGQEVDINVVGDDASSPSESPAAAPGPATSSTSDGSSSSETPAAPVEGSSSTPGSSSSASSLYSSNFWLAAPGMLAVLVAGFAF